MSKEILNVTTVYMKGEETVEIGTSRWEEIPFNPNHYRKVGGDSIEAPGEIDRIIFEFPNGCQEIALDWGYQKGDVVQMLPADDTTPLYQYRLQACQRATPVERSVEAINAVDSSV